MCIGPSSVRELRESTRATTVVESTSPTAHFFIFRRLLEWFINRTCLGVSVSSEVIGIDKNPVVTKKLKHNASERDRQKKINSLFSSLRSCLPASDQSVSSYSDKSYMSLYYLEEEYKTNTFFFTFLQKKLSIPKRFRGA